MGQSQDVRPSLGAPQPAQPPVSEPAAPDVDAQGPAAQLEFRCPIGRGGLLLKMWGRGEAHVDSDNLIEVECRSCRADARRERPTVTHVLHRFAMDGAHVETVETRAGDV